MHRRCGRGGVESLFGSAAWTIIARQASPPLANCANSPGRRARTLDFFRPGGTFLIPARGYLGGRRGLRIDDQPAGAGRGDARRAREAPPQHENRSANSSDI